MALTKIPRSWASNTTFSGGAHAGDTVKVDPGSAIAANGFYPDVGFAAEHVNYQLSPMADIDRRAFALQALKLRHIQTLGTTVTDTASSVVAIQRNLGTPLVVVKVGQAFGLGDTDRLHDQGTPATLSAKVTGIAVAKSGTVTNRIVITGDGGNDAEFSNNDGATWTASAAAVGIINARLIWAPNAGFVAFSPSSGNIFKSNDGTTAWASTALAAGAASCKGVAELTNNDIVALRGDGANAPSFQIQTSGAGAFAVAGGTVPNSASFDAQGCMCGGGSVIYHAGRLNSGATIQVSSSADGSTWGALASLTPPGSASFDGGVRIMQCDNTGLLVVAAATSSNTTALYASVDGADWVGPLQMYTDTLDEASSGFSVAGGRLVSTRDDMIFVSDGIGF